MSVGLLKWYIVARVCAQIVYCSTSVCLLKWYFVCANGNAIKAKLKSNAACINRNNNASLFA